MKLKDSRLFCGFARFCNVCASRLLNGTVGSEDPVRDWVFLHFAAQISGSFLNIIKARETPDVPARQRNKKKI